MLKIDIYIYMYVHVFLIPKIKFNAEKISEGRQRK